MVWFTNGTKMNSVDIAEALRRMSLASIANVDDVKTYMFHESWKYSDPCIELYEIIGRKPRTKTVMLFRRIPVEMHNYTRHTFVDNPRNIRPETDYNNEITQGIEHRYILVPDLNTDNWKDTKMRVHNSIEDSRIRTFSGKNFKIVDYEFVQNLHIIPRTYRYAFQSSVND